MEGDTGHAALVLLPRAIDVEVFEADDLAVGGRHQATDIFVEQELGVAVDIQWLLETALFDEVVVAAAVGRRRGGIDEGNAAFDAKMEQVLGVVIVHLHHKLAVPLGGGRTGALVKDHFDLIPLFERIAGDDAGDEFVLVHVVGDIQIDQVGELGAIGQVVNGHYVLVTGLVEQFDEIAADKAGTTCDYDHALFLVRSRERENLRCLSLPCSSIGG